MIAPNPNSIASSVSNPNAQNASPSTYYKEAYVSMIKQFVLQNAKTVTPVVRSRDPFLIQKKVML